MSRAGRGIVATGVALSVLVSCTATSDEPAPERAALMAAQVLQAESAPRAWALAPADGGTAEEKPLPIGTGWGPTAAEIERARRMVGELSLRERAGEVIVASYDGTGAPTRLVNDLHLGGVVAFSENITGTDQIRASNRALQRAAAGPGGDSRSASGSTRKAGSSSGSPLAPASRRS